MSLESNGGFKGQRSQARLTNQDGASQEASAANGDELQDLNKEEIERLRGSPSTLSKSSSSCSLVQNGKCLISDLNNALDKWIVDSGATDHMTHSSTKFNTYTLRTKR